MRSSSTAGASRQARRDVLLHSCGDTPVLFRNESRLMNRRCAGPPRRDDSACSDTLPNGYDTTIVETSDRGEIGTTVSESSEPKPIGTTSHQTHR